ncbi:MAG TPA: dissimilatory-type sulfite reductase subunit alpha [Nitrospirae bacterium]|nr:dissimilatory-type sulfite reductase subunit alpha [Nitrospirota bacterium]
MPKTYATPMLDELEKGPFPSFVTEMKKAAAKSDMAADALGQLERCFKDNKTHWKHGGIVGVRGYGSGVIGRYSDLPEEFPEVAHFHTVRINSIAGLFYKASFLKEMCDIWEKYGSGLTNFHGSTGDLILLGTKTEALEPIFTEFSSRGWDLGGSGSAMRTPSCCVGPARCEWSNINTLDITYAITQEFQDEMHRPAFPYKFKFKTVGCAVDCNAAIARADCSIIGTWKGKIDINQDEVANYAKKGMNISEEIVNLCPSKCMSYDGKKLTINDDDCIRCMHCITRMTKALKPTGEKGASILIGSKAPFVIGATLSWVIIPFMKMEPPYTEFFDLVRKMWEWWDEHGKNRERIGELIIRRGMREFLEYIGVDPMPQQIKEPRRDPFYFWAESDFTE